MHVFVMSWYSYAKESFLTVVGLPRFLARQQGLLCLGALVWREREGSQGCDESVRDVTLAMLDGSLALADFTEGISCLQCDHNCV
jgi:hypothetical protein